MEDVMTARATQLEPASFSRAALGDHEAFARVHAVAEPMVRRFLARRAGALAWDVRCDLVQEVFVRVWTGRGRYGGRSSPTTFVLGIAQNVLREHRRREGRPLHYRPDVGKDVPMTDRTSAGMCDQETRQRIEAAASSLPETQRLAVALDVFCEMPRKEAISLAGCSARQFTDRLHRAKRTLRRELAELIL